MLICRKCSRKGLAQQGAPLGTGRRHLPCQCPATKCFSPTHSQGEGLCASDDLTRVGHEQQVPFERDINGCMAHKV